MKAVFIYPAGLSVRTFSRCAGRVVGGRRGAIRSFSPASRRRLRSTILSLVDPRAVGERRVLFITLTIRDGGASDLKRYFRAAAERLRCSHIPYLLIWRLEYQRRGTPHLHILLLSTSTASVLTASKVLVSNFLRLTGASPAAQCIKFVSSICGLSVYVTDMSKLGQSDPGSDSPGRWWGVRGGLLVVIIPTVIWGRDAYFQALRLIRSVRRARARRRRRCWRGRGLFSEFLDASRVGDYLASLS